MAFNYPDIALQNTIYTPPSKPVQCKSYKLDFSVAGTGATTATAYTLGYLPKGAQLVAGNATVSTAVSGPSVSAATMALAVNTRNYFSGTNVFATGVNNASSATYYANFATVTAADVPITYTLTLTGGTDLTAGVIYINLLYVM